MEYYDIESDLKKCNFLIAFGGRYSGKSYGFAKYAIKDFFESGYKHKSVFILARLDVNSKHEDYFTESLSDYNPNAEIEYKHYKWYINGHLFCYHVSLSVEQSYKSAKFEGIYNICYEEFTKKDMNLYLPNEYKLFLSFLSTINRDKNINQNDIKVVCIGNNDNECSKYNPLFEGLKFDWDCHDMVLGDKYYIQKSTKKYVVPDIMLRYVKIGATSKHEVPFWARFPNNDVATKGTFEKVPDILAHSRQGFIIGDCRYIFRINNQYAVGFYQNLGKFVIIDYTRLSFNMLSANFTKKQVKHIKKKLKLDNILQLPNCSIKSYNDYMYYRIDKYINDTCYYDIARTKYNMIKMDNKSYDFYY